VITRFFVLLELEPANHLLQMFGYFLQYSEILAISSTDLELS